jgi:hypothetical protein
VGGNVNNAFSNGRGKTFKFDIYQTGDYVLSFYTAAEKNADFVIGMAKLDAKSYTESGIQTVNSEQRTLDDCHIYDLQGRRIDKNNLKTGIYIVGGRKVIMTK